MENKKLAIDLALRSLLKIEKERPLSLFYIFDRLAGRGNALWFILLSLPFCFPFDLFFLKIPVGVILAFLGLRYAFAKNLWWPTTILAKKILYPTLESMILKLLVGLDILQKVIYPRWISFSQQAFVRKLSGIVVFFLGLALAFSPPILLPLMSAFPIFCIGLGLLEDDGLMLILGYLFALFCFISCLALGYNFDFKH